MPRRSLALVFLVVTSACAPLTVALQERANPYDAATSPHRAELVSRYGQLADELATTATFYDREVRKSHTKLRVMGVLSGVGATGAGATIAVLAQPDVDDRARPGLASAGISSAVFAGLMAILPHAHQYILKEAGYARQADTTWGAFRTIEGTCGASMLNPETPLAALVECVGRVELALDAARRFSEDSPCRPPPAAVLERARR